MTSRGQVIYRTVYHAARCADCAWRGKPIAEHAPASLVRVRNGNAATHARKNGHSVTVEIRREFNRRPKVEP